MVDIFNKIGILNNGRKKPQFSNGYLIIVKKKSINKTPFKYCVEKTEYSEAATGFPADIIVLIKTIYTTEANLPFDVGGQIELNDRSVMTIKAIGPAEDKMKAYFNGDGKIGIYITLAGGPA